MSPLVLFVDAPLPIPEPGSVRFNNDTQFGCFRTLAWFVIGAVALLILVLVASSVASAQPPGDDVTALESGADDLTIRPYLGLAAQPLSPYAAQVSVVLRAERPSWSVRPVADVGIGMLRLDSEGHERAILTNAGEEVINAGRFGVTYVLVAGGASYSIVAATVGVALPIARTGGNEGASLALGLHVTPMERVGVRASVVDFAHVLVGLDIGIF